MMSHLVLLGNHPVSENITIIGKSAFDKIRKSVTNYFYGNPFLFSLNEAGVTPNNVVTFRIVLMVSGAVTYLLQKDTGAVMMTLSCILDATDGKLARNFNKKSKEGEIYDPASDKITEIILSLISCFNLNGVQSVVQVSSMIPKTFLHYRSQFNEKRGSFRDQMIIYKDLVVNGDKNVEYLKNTTDGASNRAGKWKTGLQFTSGLGIIWAHTGLGQRILEILLDIGIPTTIEEVTDYLTWIFIGAGITSLPFALKSVGGRKDKTEQKESFSKELSEKEINELINNPVFLYILIGCTILSISAAYGIIEVKDMVLSLLGNSEK